MRPPSPDFKEVSMSPKMGVVLLTLIFALFGVLAVRVARRLIRERVARLSSSSE